MSKELADIVFIVAAASCSLVMGMVLWDVRSLRTQVQRLAEQVATMQGALSARRKGDWEGDERRGE